jgi:hypothetical protein
MDQREALYEYLRQKSAKRQDPMQDAYKLSDAGNLLGAFSEAASMSGQLQGKRAESDIIPTVNKGLYQTSKDAANAEIALEDQQTKRLKLMQYLSEKSKPSKMQLQKDLMSPTGNPVLMDEYGKEMRELPGYKIRERPSALVGGGQIVPGYEKEGAILMKGPQGFYEQKLPKGFEPKKNKATTLTEGERKSALQADVAAKELMRLQDIEKQYTPSAKDLITGAVPKQLFGNFIRSPLQQRYSDANIALADVMLRTKSGANFTRDEMIAQIESYSIQPGDSPEAIEDKKARRAEFVNAMIKSGGRGTEGMEQIDVGSTGDLSPEEQAELDALEAEFGGGQ